MTRKSRKTRQKELIEKDIFKFNTLFTAEDLHKRVLKKEKIGIATIYRFLKEFEKTGKVYSYMCERKKIYSTKRISHCHYICEKTGRITHFDIDSLDFLKEIKHKIPGTITSVSLEIRGTCNKCN